MLVHFALFALATVGSKLVLAVVAMYYMLPTDAHCMTCGGETVPLVAWRGLRALGRRLRIQRRWCVGCRETMLVRGRRDARVWVGHVTTEPRVAAPKAQ